MINYYVELAEISNNVIGDKKSILNYETELFPLNQEEQNELIKEIISKEEVKKMFPNADNVIITELIPTHMFLEKNNKTDNPLYETSKTNWNNTRASEKYQKRRLQESYKEIINATKLIIETTNNQNLQDSQDFLNFLDKLNKLSVSH